MPPHSFPQLASYCVVAALAYLAVQYGLLPGVLAACFGYMATDYITGPAQLRRWRLSPFYAAGAVLTVPLLLLIIGLLNAKGMALEAASQYRALLQHLATTVLELRDKLPADIAGHIPAELISVQNWIAQYLKTQSSALANMGKSGLNGSLFAYVGLVVGALIRGTPVPVSKAPLKLAMRDRGRQFIAAFKQIVVAQFWIAVFNASCTAVFLVLVLPLFGANLPYTPMLILFTFLSSLIPVVGNLLCNSVLALTGVSVSPLVGLSCLVFLIVIHKFEYVINARCVGKRTQTSAWELLSVMFVAEAIFGVAGLVAAPLYYAYLKKELQAEKLV